MPTRFYSEMVTLVSVCDKFPWIHDSFAVYCVIKMTNTSTLEHCGRCSVPWQCASDRTIWSYRYYLVMPVILYPVRPVLAYLVRPVLVYLVMPVLVYLVRPVLLYLVMPVQLYLARSVLLYLARPVLLYLVRPVLLYLVRPNIWILSEELCILLILKMFHHNIHITYF